MKISIRLFLFLFSFYLLSYAPILHSSDGQAMFATAESLARRGAFDIEQIRWMDLQQGTYGLDGLLYSRKGLGQPLLALPLTAIGLFVPFFGTMTATILFGSFVTALTGVLIYLLLVQLGYERWVGVIASLVYGTGTLAWPYAKTFFSDPLAGFLLLAALLTLHQFKKTDQKRYLFLAGISLGWAVATRYAEAIFLPVFGLLFLAYLIPKFRSKGWKSIWLDGVIFGLPILIIGIALMSFNFIRYGDPLNTGYLEQETFSAIWWQGITGQLVSPGRGILLYSPILILTFFGLRSFWRHHKLELGVCLAVIVIHLLLYGKWFMWHGGFAWGPRFMIPTLPFWVILMGPVLTRLDGKSGWKWLIYLLWGVSFLIQIPGVFVHFNLWQDELLKTGLTMFAPVTFFSPAYSPLLQTWQFITLEHLNVAWVYEGQIQWVLFGLLLFNVVVSGIVLWPAISSPPSPLNKAHLFPLSLVVAATVYLMTQSHQQQPNSIKQALALVHQKDRPLIYHVPEQAVSIAEAYKGFHPVLGIATLDPTHLDQFLANKPEIWWVSTYQNDIENHLRGQYAVARQATFGENRTHLFVRPDGQPQVFDLPFQDGVQLQSVHLSQNFYPNHPFAVEITWAANTTPSTNYNVFIHLNDATGQTVAQADGQPRSAARPTTSWMPQETVIDPHALWLDDLAPSTYTLIAGLYDPQTGERLLTEGGDHFVTLGTFQVFE
ncbi:MAG: glycosyltransferase family 39 protein [Chloroflexota bacterium]